MLSSPLASLSLLLPLEHSSTRHNADYFVCVYISRHMSRHTYIDCIWNFTCVKNSVVPVLIVPSIIPVLKETALRKGA